MYPILATHTMTIETNSKTRSMSNLCKSGYKMKKRVTNPTASREERANMVTMTTAITNIESDNAVTSLVVCV